MTNWSRAGHVLPTGAEATERSMKILDQPEDATLAGSAISYAGLIEKIEILRSTLRWSSRLERPDIEKLLRQASSLRDEVMQLSHKERFVQAAAAEPKRVDQSPRRAAAGAARAQLHLRGHVRRQSEAARSAGNRGEGRADRPARADRRRKRHRQGADGEGDPRERLARGQAVYLRQLRRDSGQPAGVGTVRAQQGRVHRRVE